jgi:uncharacterized membrane protein YciS (DUF1049 family)
MLIFAFNATLFTITITTIAVGGIIAVVLCAVFFLSMRLELNPVYYYCGHSSAYYANPG